MACGPPLTTTSFPGAAAERKAVDQHDGLDLDQCLRAPISNSVMVVVMVVVMDLASPTGRHIAMIALLPAERLSLTAGLSSLSR
jgi:hypothetical protein